MVQQPAPRTDPILSAAGMLRRIGFFILMIGVPTLAFVSRRALVALTPIAIALIIIAALIDGANKPLRESRRVLLSATPAIATLVLLGWIALSLIWTPFFDPAASRVVSILATTALGIAAYFAIPARMRSANLYLVPIGVAAAALLAGGIYLAQMLGVEAAARLVAGETYLRGLVVLVMAVWPAVAWLSSRGRDAQALALAVVVGAASALSPDKAALFGFLAGATICVLASAWPAKVAAAVATGMAVAILAAPALPFLATPLGAGAPGSLLESLAIWRATILADPWAALTGHGIEAVLRSRLAGALSWNAPSSILFEIWYELGVIGAAAAATALAGAVRASARRHAALVPGEMAGFTSAFVMAALGVATTQMWWVTTLVVVALIFIAGARGQFRTKRPRIMLPGLARRE
ncbi:MAG: peptide ABC transporter permease [Salinarimonadaceae bacterium]|nr:MAG: peptide ABC transporter permease [Salinarimonadaceae bacterium]